jgi:hypothetical protein
MARVFAVIATYYAVAAGILAASAWCSFGKRRLLATAFCGCSPIGLIALGLTARSRADTWTYELAGLARLPLPIATAGSENRIYLAVEEKTLPPSNRRRRHGRLRARWASYSAKNNRLLTLDVWHGAQTAPAGLLPIQTGSTVGTAKPSLKVLATRLRFLARAPASELWLWKTSTGVISKVDAPWELSLLAVVSRTHARETRRPRLRVAPTRSSLADQSAHALRPR